MYDSVGVEDFSIIYCYKPYIPSGFLIRQEVEGGRIIDIRPRFCDGHKDFVMGTRFCEGHKILCPYGWDGEEFGWPLPASLPIRQGWIRDRLKGRCPNGRWDLWDGWEEIYVKPHDTIVR